MSEAASDGAVACTVTIGNQKGLHARAAAKFVKLATSFEADIVVSKQNVCVSGRSILGLMMLAAAPGCRLELTAKGPDAEQAIAGLAALIDRKFDED
jgi:phosphocarrier protein HPr